MRPSGGPALGQRAGRRPIAIVGGCGFVGSNLARSYLDEGREVVVLDNLSRTGVEQNLAWLRDIGGSRLTAVMVDARDARLMAKLLADCGAIFHLAAQTAVTTSLEDPVEDFEVNGRGTLNVLEAARRSGRQLPVIFSSTNKVYGDLGDLEMTETDDRYLPAARDVRVRGIDESRPLELRTPYGCSKGLADQYVLDYAASFGLPTAVLRMSCIYGPRQFGTEDQGWVAHFMLRALQGSELTVYGNGKQVRDVLFVDDAVAAYRLVLRQIEQLRGRAFNLGGGPANAVSLRAVLTEIERMLGRNLDVRYEDWRKGDQYYFVADTRRLEAATGWRAETPWRDGLRLLATWLGNNRHIVEPRPAFPALREVTA